MAPEINKINDLRVAYQNAQQVLLQAITNLDRVLGEDQPDPQQYGQADSREALLHAAYRAAATELYTELKRQQR
jgi:hypothetical protein